MLLTRKIHQSFAVFFVVLVDFVVGFAEKRCNASELIQNQCTDTEICIQTLTFGLCKCLEGYVRVNGSCFVQPATTEPPSRASFISNDEDEHGKQPPKNHHAVAGIFIGIFVVAFLMCGVYVAYRYKFVGWLRGRMSQRNVDYDEFMIGQEADDDPPLH